MKKFVSFYYTFRKGYHLKINVTENQPNNYRNDPHGTMYYSKSHKSIWYKLHDSDPYSPTYLYRRFYADGSGSLQKELAEDCVRVKEINLILE